ncbi:MAG: hypothetical protein JXA81_15030, partial [Sedimentisphaerales bacterium]|nr:hypothetical protein [Sedimentisphaerales bacterium]
MSIPEITDNYTGSVNRVTLGATKENGGSRTSTITIGGAKNVVYGGGADQASEKPVIAIDVLDSEPDDWPELLAEPYKDVLDNPAEWAKKCIEEYGADLICLKFEGIHPDKGDKDADHAAKVTKDVLKAVGVPLVLWGCGN